MMTKKHYIEMAKALKHVQPGNNTKSNWLQWEKDIQAIAFVCKNDNPNFDYTRFVNACKNGMVQARSNTIARKAF